MSYLDSDSFIGFVGSGPEQSQARNDAAKFVAFLRRRTTLFEKRR